MTYLLLVVGFICLIGAGEILVRGATAISLRFKIQPFVIGMTVVAFGTSAPELLVSLMAALEGHPDIATGNVVGSNISNIAMVLGATAFVYPIAVSNEILKRDWPIVLAASLLLFFFAFDGELVFYEGAIMFASLLVYLFYIIKTGLDNNEGADDVDEALADQNIAVSAFFILGGCVGLVFGADLLVDSAVKIAQDFNISERVVSLTVVAIGTSLPELATSVMAAFKKETDIALGNILGSNLFNILSILGATSMIETIHVHEDIINHDMLWMLGVTVVLFPLMLTKRRISKAEGLILSIAYIVYFYLVF